MTRMKHGEKAFMFGIFEHDCALHLKSDKQRNVNYSTTGVFVDGFFLVDIVC